MSDYPIIMDKQNELDELHYHTYHKYEDPYLTAQKYIKLNKRFLFGLIERGLERYFMNPKNQGIEPFVSTKIFQFDPDRMKDNRDEIIKKQSIENPIIKVKKTKVTNKIIKKKNN